MEGIELAGAIGHDRVRAHSSPSVNARMDEDLVARAGRYPAISSESLVQRLAGLDREWDVDRSLMMNFAVVGGLAAWMALRQALAERRLGPWAVLFGAQIGFLVLHSTVGWCPPVVAFRRLGCRTDREIGAERQMVLSELRGRTAATH